jgi:hypothetical protein
MQIDEASQKLYDLVQDELTPMMQYLDSNEMSNKVSFKKFDSLLINTSPDKILYKNVVSNPEDKIDKIINFPEVYPNSLN